MKFYLCGPCDTENRTNMQHIASVIRNSVKDCEVYCPFELKIPNAWDMSQERWAEKVFEADVKAIQECDFFIMFSLGRISSAGTNWEQGYAYAFKKPIFTIQMGGAPTSIMTYCSANRFFNCEDMNGVIESIKFILETNLLDYTPVHYYCSTVLT